MTRKRIEKRIKILLGFFIIGLFISGLTAIPISHGAAWLHGKFGENSALAEYWPSMAEWISTVNTGVQETSLKYPFISYGTDWLAFGHFILALAFLGPLRDPVKNVWVVRLGIIACLLVIPYALIFGYVREIPFYWRLIDCSFGVLGIIPLWLVNRYILRLENKSNQTRS